MHAVAKVKSIVLAFERSHKYMTTNATLDGEIVLRNHYNRLSYYCFIHLHIFSAYCKVLAMLCGELKAWLVKEK